MKSKINAKSFLNKALTNKYVLYIVAFIAFLSLLQHIMNKEFTAVILFYLVGFVTYYYSKNMTIILGVSFIATLFADLVKNLLNIREGFQKNIAEEEKEKQEEEQQEQQEKQNNLLKSINENSLSQESSSQNSSSQKSSSDDKDEGDNNSTEVTDGFKNKKAKRSGYQNQLKLNPSVYNMPNKKQMEKQLGDASKLELAYDNLEKVIGNNGIQSLSGNTEELIKKQNKIMKQMKEITPTLQNAMESVSKIDLGKISQLMTGITND
tara:strand:- start:206 stop:1000 length:795 start_codon:yes stop_codon:yes gene_type:complete